MVERLDCFWTNQGTQRGYSGFSSDGDDRMDAKIPGTSNKTLQNSLDEFPSLKN